jgi:hypothetical protein
MNAIDLKQQVQQALRSEWSAFAAAHPNLAAALDDTVLVEPVIRSLADDAEYREAMATAEAVGAGAQVIADTVAAAVRRWLRQLL